MSNPWLEGTPSDETIACKMQMNLLNHEWSRLYAKDKGNKKYLPMTYNDVYIPGVSYPASMKTLYSTACANKIPPSVFAHAVSELNNLKLQRNSTEMRDLVSSIGVIDDQNDIPFIIAKHRSAHERVNKIHDENGLILKSFDSIIIEYGLFCFKETTPRPVAQQQV